MKQKYSIGPFLGPVTSVDPSVIGRSNSSDELNVTHEDGVLRHRDGYTIITSAIDNVVNVGLLQYVSGYDSNYVNQKEVLMSYSASGPPTTYTVNRYDATSTLGNKATLGNPAIQLDSAIAFDGTAYLWNATTPTAGYLYTHTVGTDSSWAAVAIPTKPATALGFKKTVTVASTDYDTYIQYSAAGIDPTSASEMACTGAATNTNSALVNNQLIAIGHTASATAQTSTVKIDLSTGTSGKPDWYYNDCFAFRMYAKTYNAGLEAYVKINWDTVKIELYDENDALLSSDDYEVKYSSNHNYWYVIRYKNKTRGSWGNGSGTGKVRYIKYTYTTTGTTSSNAVNNLVYIETPVIGGVWMVPAGTDPKSNDLWSFGYTYRINSSGAESEVSGEITVKKKQLFSLYYDDGASDTTVPFANLGVHLKLSFPSSSESAVDKVRIYWKDTDSDTWQYVVEAADNGTSTYCRLSYNELLALTDYTRRQFDLVKPITCATGYKGWMVWGYKDGYQNIKHSRIGEPLAHATSTDLEDDLNRGATFTLSDNMHDAPVAMHQAGDALVILGTYGVYVQWGDRPSNMTPPTKIQAEWGVINPFASCTWMDDKGAPTVVYMDKRRTGIYSVALVPYQSGKVVEMTSMVRTKFDWLTVNGAYDSDVRVLVNQNDSSLWVICRTRAMVLRRPSMIDGKRYWELYEYNLPTATDSASEPYFHMATFVPDVPALLTVIQEPDGTSSARMARMEYSYTPSSGPSTYDFCDGGEMPVQAFWTSKTFGGRNRRINHVELDKSDTENSTLVKCVSDRKSTTKTIKIGKRSERFGFDQQGWNHTFTIYVDPDDTGISGMAVEEFVPQGGRPLA